MASLTRSGEGKINGAGFARTSGQYRSIPIRLEAPQDLTLQRRSIIQDPTLQRRSIIQDPTLQRRSIARVQSDGGREEPVNVEASEDFIDGGRGDSVDVGASEDFINGRRGDHGGVEASEDFIKPLWEQFNNGLRNRRDFFQASAWTPRETSPVVMIGEILDNQRLYKIKDFKTVTQDGIDDIYISSELASDDHENDETFNILVSRIDDSDYEPVLSNKIDDSDYEPVLPNRIDDSDYEPIVPKDEIQENQHNVATDLGQTDIVPEIYESEPKTNLKSCLKTGKKCERSQPCGTVYINSDGETQALSLRPRVNFVPYHIVSFFYKRDSEWETYHPYETLDFRSDEDNPDILEQDSIYEAVEFNIAPVQGAEDLSITTDQVTVNTSGEDYNEDNLQKTKLNISEELKLDNKPPHSPSKEDSKGFRKKHLKKKMSTKKSKDCVMT